MPEVRFILSDDGVLHVETDDLAVVGRELESLVGKGEPVNCGLPARSQMRQFQPSKSGALGPRLRVAGYWYGDHTSGPGSRSVVQVQGCSIRCPGCYVPQTHDQNVGLRVLVDDVIGHLIPEQGSWGDDVGVTILGGEPFDQSAALLSLVDRLVALSINTWVYSGYTFERLIEDQVNVWVLAQIDGLIDGPYIRALAQGAGEWRGSTNQRVMERGEIRTRLRLRG